MSERKPEQRCAKCGEERTARGGDLHCYADCDWFGHGEPGNCHPFVLPTESETERCICGDCDIDGCRGDCGPCWSELGAALYGSAPSETPSPEVGMRERAHALLDKMIDAPKHRPVIGVFAYEDGAWLRESLTLRAAVRDIRAAAKEQSK